MSKVSISLLHVACKVSLMTDISPNWSHEQYKLHIIFFHHEDENMNSEYLQHSRSYDHKEEETKFDQVIWF